MRALLPIIFVTLVLITTVSLANGSQETEYDRVVISNSAEHIAKSVFVGIDSEMLITGKYEISINPSRDKDGHIVIPDTLSGAMLEMKRALPHWYTVALMESEGDHECFVFVNGADMRTLVGAWFWSKWNLGSEDSSLRKAMASLGIRAGSENMIMKSALLGGFCAFIKTGDMTRAKEAIASFANFERELMRDLQEEASQPD